MMKTPSGKTAFDNKYYFPQKENGKKLADIIIIIEDIRGTNPQDH